MNTGNFNDFVYCQIVFIKVYHYDYSLPMPIAFDPERYKMKNEYFLFSKYLSRLNCTAFCNIYFIQNFDIKIYYP